MFEVIIQSLLNRWSQILKENVPLKIQVFLFKTSVIIKIFFAPSKKPPLSVAYTLHIQTTQYNLSMQHSIMHNNHSSYLY